MEGVTLQLHATQLASMHPSHAVSTHAQPPFTLTPAPTTAGCSCEGPSDSRRAGAGHVRQRRDDIHALYACVSTPRGKATALTRPGRRSGGCIRPFVGCIVCRDGLRMTFVRSSPWACMDGCEWADDASPSADTWALLGRAAEERSMRSRQAEQGEVVTRRLPTNAPVASTHTRRRRRCS